MNDTTVNWMLRKTSEIVTLKCFQSESSTDLFFTSHSSQNRSSQAIFIRVAVGGDGKSKYCSNFCSLRASLIVPLMAKNTEDAKKQFAISAFIIQHTKLFS